MSPWEKLLTNLANLFKVKTIITMGIVFVFCFMLLHGFDIGNEFIMILTAVITYYFTRKDGQNEQN